jgi:hypothetical protein
LLGGVGALGVVLGLAFYFAQRRSQRRDGTDEERGSLPVMPTSDAMDATMLILHIDVDELACCLTAALQHSALTSIDGLLRAVSQAAKEASGLKLKLKPEAVKVEALDLGGETISSIQCDADCIALHDAHAIRVTTRDRKPGTRANGAAGEGKPRKAEKKSLLQSSEHEVHGRSIQMD